MKFGVGVEALFEGGRSKAAPPRNDATDSGLLLPVQGRHQTLDWGA